VTGDLLEEVGRDEAQALRHRARTATELHVSCGT
jgi:hypothetical protein